MKRIKKIASAWLCQGSKQRYKYLMKATALFLILISNTFISGSPAGAQAWIKLSPTGNPTQGLFAHSAVFEPGINQRIVFGGRGDGFPLVNLNHVFRLPDANGIGTPTWIAVNPGGTFIPARFSHTAVYDACNDRVIVFGGGKGFSSPCTNEVWVLVDSNQKGEQLFRFDPKWQANEEGPFIPSADGFSLRVNIGAAYSMVFPKTLNSKTPIVINTRYGEVRQFLQGAEIYQANLSGRYLVYRGKEQSVLFRYDKDEKALREFVYLPSAESLKKDGTVIRWRYEGAELFQRKDGSVVFSREIDPMGDIKKIADQNMATRISKFLENQQGTALPDKPVTKTLFVVPQPEYVDGNLNTKTNSIRYETMEMELKLVLMSTQFRNVLFLPT